MVNRMNYSDWCNLYPEYVVIRKEGYFYSAKGISAQTIHILVGFKLGTLDDGTFISGCPKLEKMTDALRYADFSYVVIEADRVMEKFDGSRNLQNTNIATYKSNPCLFDFHMDIHSTVLDAIALKKYLEDHEISFDFTKLKLSN